MKLFTVDTLTEMPFQPFTLVQLLAICEAVIRQM